MSKRQKGQRQPKHSLIQLGEELPPPKPVKRKAPIEPKTDAQKHYINSIRHNRITFGIGPAGTGKTYCSARIAAEELLEKTISKIILTRPAVEAGGGLGFLPGEMDEKMAPYIASYGRGFEDELGSGHFEYLMRTGKIEIVPLEFMQGRSFDEPTLVLFDEAQNATPFQMKMVLTRLGEGARLVIDGDPRQVAIKGKSGLIDGFNKIRYLNHVDAVEFTRDDIVRDGLVREILDAYEAQDDDQEDDQSEQLPDFITRP